MTAEARAARETRAVALLAEGHTRGRVAELTALPIGAVDRLAGPRPAPAGLPSLPVPIPARVDRERCAAGLGCARDVIRDSMCATHLDRAEAKAQAERTRTVAAQQAASAPPTPPVPPPTPAEPPVRPVEPAKPAVQPKPAKARPPRPAGCEAPGCTRNRGHGRWCATHVGRLQKYGTFDLPTARTLRCGTGHFWQAPVHTGQGPRYCPDHMAAAAAQRTRGTGTPRPAAPIHAPVTAPAPARTDLAVREALAALDRAAQAVDLARVALQQVSA